MRFTGDERCGAGGFAAGGCVVTGRRSGLVAAPPQPATRTPAATSAPAARPTPAYACAVAGSCSAISALTLRRAP
jgi:hypothetical protein